MKYFGDVRRELRKVTWPSFSETSHFTWISILFIILFALYFALTDTTFSALMDWFVNL